MSILLMPTDISGATQLDRQRFLATQPADSKWQKLIYSLDARDWTEELQDEFEAAIEAWWQENPEIEQGFWPSGKEKAEHASKIEAKALVLNEPKIASARDMRDKEGAQAMYDAAIRAVKVQEGKIAACKFQVLQSEQKLAVLQEKLEAATRRLSLFSNMIAAKTEDF